MQKFIAPASREGFNVGCRSQLAIFFSRKEGVYGTVGLDLSIVNRKRMRILYSGNVQGVGFRYTVQSVAAGYDVVGTVKNLPDGRVELVGEGAKDELEAFRHAIRESGLDGHIRDEAVDWSDAQGGFRGFEIAR